jgi:ferritin
MRLSQNLNDALNIQVAHELQNSIIYMQIASYFESKQLKNIASYFMKLSCEEKDHANKFLNYINDRTGGKVEIPEIEETNLILDDAQVCQKYVATEENTTLSIESIYELALTEKSYMDLAFLQTMLFEQIEEEDDALNFTTRFGNVRDQVLFDATFGK